MYLGSRVGTALGRKELAADTAQVSSSTAGIQHLDIHQIAAPLLICYDAGRGRGTKLVMLMLKEEEKKPPSPASYREALLLLPEGCQVSVVPAHRFS